MPDDITASKANFAAACNLAKPFHCINKTTFAVWREVDLRGIPLKHHFRANSQASQKHFHLGCSCVLRFVQNDKGIVECSTSHIGERNHFDDILLCQLFQ